MEPGRNQSREQPGEHQHAAQVENADIDEASEESFPASDPPASRVRHEFEGRHAPEPDIDEQYWRKAILQRDYYKPGVGFDRYRWALHFGEMERKRHKDDINFSDVLADLEAGWKKFGGPSQLTWEEARAAITDSWEHTHTMLAEKIAGRAGFKRPPTFCEHGGVVPRNIDEPNS